MATIQEIPVLSIVADDGQPRKTFKKEALAELAQSIAKNGLLQPISVRRMEDGMYQIIAGERRYRAVCTLEEETIPAIVVDTDELKAKELQLLENIVREDLNPLEEVQAYQSFIDRGYSVGEVAEIVGRTKNIVSWQMNILKCRDDIQHMIGAGQMSLVVGIALSKLSINGQGRALRTMTQNALTPTECQCLCDRLHAEECSIEMFTDTKLTEEQKKARAKVMSAIDRAGTAVNDLLKVERDNPGITGSAIAESRELTELKINELMRNLRTLKNIIKYQRIEGLAA